MDDQVEAIENDAVKTQIKQQGRKVQLKAAALAIIITIATLAIPVEFSI